MSVYPNITLNSYLYVFTYIFIYLYLHLFISSFTYIFICLYLHLFIYSYIHLLVSLYAQTNLTLYQVFLFSCGSQSMLLGWHVQKSHVLNDTALLRIAVKPRHFQGVDIRRQPLSSKIEHSLLTKLIEIIIIL